MASTPIFTAKPRCTIVQVSVANTNRDGTGTIATVFTPGGGAIASRIDAVTVKAIGSTTAGMVRLFLDDGANSRLIDEIDVTAVTVGATTKAFSSTTIYKLTQPIIVPAGWTLRASTHNAETFNVICFGGDF